jgi:hypothetical protein
MYLGATRSPRGWSRSPDWHGPVGFVVYKKKGPSPVSPRHFPDGHEPPKISLAVSSNPSDECRDRDPVRSRRPSRYCSPLFCPAAFLASAAFFAGLAFLAVVRLPFTCGAPGSVLQHFVVSIKKELDPPIALNPQSRRRDIIPE